MTNSIDPKEFYAEMISQSVDELMQLRTEKILSPKIEALLKTSELMLPIDDHFIDRYISFIDALNALEFKDLIRVVSRTGSVASIVLVGIKCLHSYGYRISPLPIPTIPD